MKEIGSFGISLIPFLGDGKDLQESISGLDLITGKKLSALERVLAGACVIVPVVSGSMVRIAGKNADIAEKMSLLSEKQLFKKAGKGFAMCEDAKKEMEQLIQEIRTMLEEDADIKRLFIRKTGTGPQVEIAGVGKVSLEEAEKLVGKDVRWSKGDSGSTIALTQKNVEMPKLPEGSQWERNVLNSFEGGKAIATTYKGGTTLYRIGGKNGGFWSLDPPPITEYQWRVAYAIKQEFCNNASTLYKMTIPEGASLKALEGKVGTQGRGLYGGAHQAYIDYRAVPTDWIEITPAIWKRGNYE